MSLVEISRYYRYLLFPSLGSNFTEKDLICDKNITCKRKTTLEGRNCFLLFSERNRLFLVRSCDRETGSRTTIESRCRTYMHAYVMIHPAVFRPSARTWFLAPTRCVWYSKVNTSNKQMPVILLIRVALTAEKLLASTVRKPRAAPGPHVAFPLLFYHRAGSVFNVCPAGDASIL